ncbi:MAG: mycothiol transferase [Actinomycetes bacterium]
MTPADLLVEAFGRLSHTVPAAVEGLSPEQLSARLDPDANSIGWLVWHLTRVQDDHVAKAFGTDQRYTADGWAERFALPFDEHDIGYGHRSDQVAAVQADAALLTGYARAVQDRTIELLSGVTAEDLDRVVDRSWDPPVTLGVRLVSVLEDCLQHVGQAAFARGLLERST